MSAKEEGQIAADDKNPKSPAPRWIQETEPPITIFRWGLLLSYAVTGARRIEPGGPVGCTCYLVGDDGDEGGVVGGDVGPPRHGSQPRMLPSLRFLVLQRIRWSSTQSEIGSYSDGGHEQEGRGRRDPEDEEEQGGPHLRLLPVGCRQDQGNFQVGRAQHGAGHVGHQHNP